jgi:ATP-dependent Clp protease ATP-binding subunit ClpA
MNGYNFTERVRKVLAMSREESVRLHHEYVGTEHILLGLIREGGGVANQVLSNLGVNVERVRELVDATVKKGTRSPGPDLPYTSRAKKVLELALAEARELNHSYVGTEHLLLGLLREEKGIAAKILESEGVTVRRARAETLQLLGNPETNARGAAPAPSERGNVHRVISGPERVRPDDAVAQFYTAFNTRDLELMARNWSRSARASMCNPVGGIAHGWGEISAVYARLFDGAVRVRVELKPETFTTVGFFCCLVGREHGTAERDGRAVELSIRTTRIFALESGEWHQLHHHGSIDDPAMLRAYQELVAGD